MQEKKRNKMDSKWQVSQVAKSTNINLTLTICQQSFTPYSQSPKE